MATSMLYRIQLQKKHLEGAQKRLEALSPLAVLERGYAVVTCNENGQVVSRIAQVQPGEAIRVRVTDGKFDAEVSSEHTHPVSTIVNRKS
jgi:exodeoxyribonuclease VII large subunit